MIRAYIDPEKSVEFNVMTSQNLFFEIFKFDHPKESTL